MKIDEVLKEKEKELFLFRLKEKVLEIVKKVFGISLRFSDFDLSSPKNFVFGDYASNIGFILAKDLKQNPAEISKKLAESIKDEIFLKVEPSGGYLNFSLKPEFIFKKIKDLALDSEIFSKKDFLILFEFGQPNTHKDPHIGHLYSYVLGESLVRVFEFLGFKIKRANYQGDIGLHVAKCLYGIMQKKDEFRKLVERQPRSFDDFKNLAKFLQESYVLGSQFYEENEQARKKIDEINKALYLGNNKELIELWKKTREWSLNFYKKFEEILEVSIDRYYFESEVWREGKKIILENLGKVFEQSEGAIVFKGEKYGLHTRVFITKHGNPTYEGKEIGLISLKLKEFNPDFLVVTTAKEQAEYFKVVITAADLIFKGLKEKFKHVPFGMVNLKTGKMSSRKGNIISAVDLYEGVKKEIIRAYDVDEETAQKVALSAIKYSFLNLEAEKDMVFDIEESIAKEGNSGPYLLYTYVRAEKILEKGKIKEIYIPDSSFWNQLSFEEKLLFKQLLHFEEIILKSAKDFSVHYISNFLFETAKLYNKIYQSLPILKAEEPLRSSRLFLTFCYKNILRKGLYLLGIETVDRL